MIAGTSIEYNDIVMDDVLTTQWLEEVVYDTTGVDALYTKLTATFSGVLHGSAIKQHAPESIPIQQKYTNGLTTFAV